MKSQSNDQITIAIPGEKRNGLLVKEFLLQEGFIQPNDMNLEVIQSEMLGARLVQMRARDAITRLTGTSDIELLIAGLDQIREFEQGEEIFDGKDLSKISYTPEGLQLGNALPPSYILPFVFDSEFPTKIQIIAREEEQEIYSQLPSLIGCKVLTPYPNLLDKILKQRKVSGAIDAQKIGGKTEAMVRAGFGDVGVDVVDTGMTARRNCLVPTEVLFESYPASLVSSTELEQNRNLRKVVQILTDASNATYYNSFRYRQQYPRG